MREEDTVCVGSDGLQYCKVCGEAKEAFFPKGDFILTLKGKDLHVSRLTVEKGEVDVQGTVDHMAYSSNEAHRKAGQSLISRLFQ